MSHRSPICHECVRASKRQLMLYPLLRHAYRTRDHRAFMRYAETFRDAHEQLQSHPCDHSNDLLELSEQFFHLNESE
jgi:hypothetical protein